MSKVLISFLGTGKVTERRYSSATYRFENGDEEQSPFIASALSHHYGIDKIILIGTIKSMWEEVYFSYANQRGVCNEGIWIEIGNVCQESNYQSELELPHQKQIEQVLGGDSHIVLIKYGLNEDEIQYNAEQILRVEQFLSDGDELYVDITHSFRSLPIYLMNCLTYLKQVSQKKVEIKHITYGMLDVTRELGYTPVVDLISVLNVNDWISGAYSFATFGNAYKIASLLSPIDKSAAKRLIDFSDAKNLNYLDALEKQVQQLSGLDYASLPYIAQMVIPPVVNNFRQELKRSQVQSHAQFQYNLAKWHFENMNYSAAFITLTEAIITWVCEKEGADPVNKEARDGAKTLISDRKYADIRKMYSKVNNCRRQIAHSITGTRNCSDMIKTLKESILFFGKYIK